MKSNKFTNTLKSFSLVATLLFLFIGCGSSHKVEDNGTTTHIVTMSPVPSITPTLTSQPVGTKTSEPTSTPTPKATPYPTPAVSPIPSTLPSPSPRKI